MPTTTCIFVNFTNPQRLYYSDECIKIRQIPPAARIKAFCVGLCERVNCISRGDRSYDRRRFRPVVQHLYIIYTAADKTATVVASSSYLWALCRRPGTVCRRRAERSDSWTGRARPTRRRRRRLSSRPTDNLSSRSVAADGRRTSSGRQRFAVNGRRAQENYNSI